VLDNIQLYTIKSQTEQFILYMYFSSHIRALLCALLVVFIAMVVLAVTYLDHLENCYCYEGAGSTSVWSTFTY